MIFAFVSRISTALVFVAGSGVQFHFVFSRKQITIARITFPPGYLIQGLVVSTASGRKGV